MFRRFLVSCITVLLALALPASALAQNYYFAVPQETVQVYWNEDGTLSLDYTLVFNNQPGAHVIDFVDMGMPNNSFDMNTVSADVNGSAVSVSESEYQGSGSGFAVVMGSQTIGPGSSGTVHVTVGRISNVLYTDSQDNTYASAVFAPTYFDSQYVTGSTDLTVVFHLPPGVQTQEPKWHSAPSGFPSEPATGLDSNGRITYTWNNPSANAHTQYKFGASFPKSYVPASAIQAEPSGLTSLFSTIFAAIAAVVGFIGSSLPCLIVAVFFFGMPLLSAINARRRKMQYLPPKISIEGHGIKRGLTAVEAAILMEQPLDKVMTMILFGVIKKEAAEVVTRDPLELKIASPLPEGLHEYETQFLEAFRPGTNLKQRRTDLQDMTIKLVKSVSEKMKGFSRKETVAFYKDIMERAWQQIAAADTPEVQSKLFDDAMEWTMLDKDYDERARRTFVGPVFVPIWWGRYDPGYGRAAGGGVQPVSVGGSVPSSRSAGLPGADFAASVVGGVQTFSQKVIGNVGDFTSRVTNTTNPPPPPSRTSGGGRSGGGCACACACAGCACACAGGGR
jgi:hypothetical protein